MNEHELTFMEKWAYTLAGSALAGFLVVVFAYVATGNTLLSFAAVTGDSMPFAERSIDGAFLGFLLGMIWRVYWMVCDMERDMERTERSCLADVEGEVRVRQGNRLVWLKDVDPDAVEAIGKGVSRRAAARSGITEHQYNKASSALKREGVTGNFEVV